MRALFLLALSICLLTTCKKKTVEYTVEGTVTDASFATTLAGATVKLTEFPAGNSSPSGTSQTVQVGSDGKFSFSFQRSKVEKYQLDVTKANYFSQSETFTTDQLSTENTTTFNFSATAKSWVRLRFVNPDGVGALSYTKQDGKQGCSSCCPIVEQFVYDALDTSFYCINDGNTPYSILYFVIGTSTQGQPSVITVPFDTTEILVNY